MDRTPYREAVRLLSLTAHFYSELDAHYYQIDLLDLPIYRQFNLVHTWLISRIPTEEGREMFEAQMSEPMEWEKRTPVVVASSGDDEIALMRAAAGE